MAQTDVTISNKAIRLIGANTITSLSDGSNEAEIISDFYDDLVADLYSRYPWSFATKKVALVATTAPLNEYSYAHATPTGMRRLVALFNTASAGASPVKDFEIQAPTAEEVIFSNHSALWADYVRDMDEVNWPPYFVTLFYHALAALVCEPITDQTELSNDLSVKAWGSPSENLQGGLFAQAMKTDSMQQPPQNINSSTLVFARFS